MSDGCSASRPRRSAERAGPQENDPRFRIAFENLVTGMCLTAPDGTFLEANRSLCSMLGYSAEELGSRDVDSVTHPDDLAMSRECVRGLLAGERSFSRFEKRYLRSDRTTVWAEVSTTLVRGDGGQPLYFITQIQDITDRKRTDTALCESEERHHHALERARGLWRAMPGGVMVIGSDGSIVEADEAACGILGLSREQCVGRMLDGLGLQVIGEDGSPLAVADGPVMRAFATRRAVRDVAMGFYASDPQECRWMLCSVEPMLDGPGGAVREIVVTFQDITDRKRAEAALRESEEQFRTASERYRTFIDATDDLVFLKDAELRYTIVNRAQAEFFARPQAEIIGRTDRELMPDEFATASLQSDRAALRSDHAVLAEEVVGDHHYEFRKFRVDLGEGRSGVGGYARDITERRRARAALAASEHRFRQMTDILPDMVVELDPELRVTYINRAVTQVLGYTQADIGAGVGLGDALQAEDLTRAVDALVAEAASGRSRVGVYSLRRKDGTLVPTEIHSMRVVGPDGQLVGYRGVMRDISNRQQMGIP